jgi:hypothetical protein
MAFEAPEKQSFTGNSLFYFLWIFIGTTAGAFPEFKTCSGLQIGERLIDNNKEDKKAIKHGNFSRRML